MKDATRHAFSLLLALALVFTSTAASANVARGAKTVRVKSYTTKSGKTVTTHKRSTPSSKGSGGKR